MVSPEKSGSTGVLSVPDAPLLEDPIRRDDELRLRVVNFLADSNMPGLRHLEVAAAGGTVTLRGLLAGDTPVDLTLPLTP